MNSSAVLPDWLRRRERSNLIILKLMVFISLTFGRRVGGAVLHGIALYFCLFAPRARAASRAYLARVLERPARWTDLYQHVFSFARTIHDRIYLLNDQLELFDIEVYGTDELLRTLADGRGAVLVGAHMGSFEVLRSLGRERAGLNVAMMMYGQNALKISATLEAINPKAVQDIISLGRIESMLEVREKLDAGYLVGMLADRTLGDDATIDVPLLGKPARFPLGPWRMAALLRRPVFFMAGLYEGGNRYRLYLVPLCDFSVTPRGERDAVIQAAMQRYAGLLEQHCRRSPYNWFNFFDFWRQA